MLLNDDCGKGFHSQVVSNNHEEPNKSKIPKSMFSHFLGKPFKSAALQNEKVTWD
jgi:hypothetical protein